MVRTGAWRVGASSLLVLAAFVLTACGEDAATEPTGGTEASQEESSTPTDDESADPGEATEDDSTDPGDAAEEETPADAPGCGSVWQDGGKLARSYQGCVDDAGDYVERDTLACSSGQRMIRYADQFYGVLGGTVHEAAQPLDQDKDYQAAVRSCRA